jgi:signal transduction histidine kinase/CheY-like chemotaxis protein
MNQFLPRIVREYLDERLFSEQKIFGVVLGASGQVSQRFGDAQAFGLSKEGLEILDFVAGLDTHESTVVPAMQFGKSKPAHLHVIVRNGERAIVMQSADSDFAEIGQQQQLANELALVNSRQERTIAAMTQAQELLRESERELKRAHDLKSMFIGKMSHEFGTPITAVLGRMRLLEHELADQPRAAQHVTIIRRGVMHLHQLVQSVLDEARLEQGTLRLEPGRVRLAELAQDLSLLFSPVAEEKKLALQIAVEDDKQVWIDGLRVKQILINLVSNAIKYTAEGRVAVYMHWRDDKLTANVSDTGPGMTREQAASLFRPFKRLTEHAHVSGTGLGLVISRELAQHMGGAIDVRSTLGEGTNFILQIPCALADDQAVPELKRSLKVLVVDDDEDIRELLGALLLHEGMSVSLAENGKQAESRFREMSPDVILLDMQLGIEHGYEVAKMLRKQGCISRIVALSASNSGETSALALGGGCDAFLSKPVDFEKLKALMQEPEWTR